MVTNKSDATRKRSVTKIRNVHLSQNGGYFVCQFPISDTKAGSFRCSIQFLGFYTFRSICNGRHTNCISNILLILVDVFVSVKNKDNFNLPDFLNGKVSWKSSALQQEQLLLLHTHITLSKFMAKENSS